MAEPISAWLLKTFVALTPTTAAIAANFIVYAGSTLLSRMLGRGRMREPGIQTSFTQVGDTLPQSFILGRFVTAGHHVAPPNSHSDSKYLTYIIELSDLPIEGVNRVIINDTFCNVITGEPEGEFGFPLDKFRIGGTDYAWMKFYDGRQTTADPMLVKYFGEDPDRPWTTANVGPNTAYAIMTFLYKADVFSSLPQCRFEVNGIRLYDPRKDRTVGGTGSHRFNNPATWEFTRNPAVMIYNIMRGITLPTGEVWGGRVPASDLDVDQWIAAMNTCDDLIGTRPRYAAGLEIYIDEEPVTIIEELARACFGQISEIGGRFRLRVGSVGTAVLTITDEDLSISDSRQFLPFPGLSATTNAVFAEHPSSPDLWQMKAIAPQTNATYEEQDGGRQLAARLTFTAVQNPSQARQLARAYLTDARRTVSHRIVLPPEAAVLEPLDAIRWTSAANGYSNKLFEVTSIVDRVNSLMQEVAIRERDPTDTADAIDLEEPSPADATVTRPVAYVLGNLTVTSSTIGGAPALTIRWDTEPYFDTLTVDYKVRVQSTGALIARNEAPAEDGETIYIGGLTAGTVYEVQARLVADYPTAFTSWVAVTA